VPLAVVGPGAIPGVDALAFVPRLPAELRLSAAQQQRVRELTEAFVAATRADRAALEAILRELRPSPGAPPPTAEQVAAILARTAPLHARLIAATQSYREGVLGVLTAEQRAWIEAERQREVQRWQACRQNPLTDAQREQIAARTRAFEEATRADREALAPILREAEAARQAGRPAAEIQAILEPARPIRERLVAAERQLRAELLAVLTPAQRDARCWIR
jgi:Spy/CpxP family protein refolding chaperone